MTTPPHDDVDWKSLYDRLDRAKAGAARWTTPDAERSREILDARARALARRPAAAVVAAEETTELMFFTASGQNFAVALGWLLAVARIGAVERVPDAPRVFRGIVGHRGKVLAVVDLGALLTGTPTETDSTHLLVLGRNRPEIGIAVELADEVVRVPSSRIDRTVVAAWSERAAFAVGLIDGRRLVLDGELLLDEPRLTAARVER